MKKIKVIIFGTGNFSELATSFLEYDKKYTISGYCVESRFKIDDDTFNNLPVINFEEIVEKFPSNEYSLFIPIGNNYDRERLFTKAKSLGYSMISYITESVNRWYDLKFGENVFIVGNSGIEPIVEIGDNTIIIGSKIGHHAKIGNHVLLSCTTLGGNVKVGDYSFLGMNSAVKQNTVIAEKNIIGMGCNIDRDTNKNEVYSSTKSTIKRQVSAEQINENYI